MKNTPIFGLFILTLSLVNCSKKDPIANRAEINSITLKEFSNQNNGSSWDSFGGAPDPYIEVYQGGTLILTGDYSSDAVSPTSIQWTPTNPIDVKNLSDNFTIDIYDHDNAAADDYMGSISFSLNSYKYDEPSTKELTYGNLKIELSLNWLYEK